MTVINKLKRLIVRMVKNAGPYYGDVYILLLYFPVLVPAFALFLFCVHNGA